MIVIGNRRGINMPKLSIIVPIYGVEKYISNCVDSILMQDFTDFELILVDDGSKDACPSICDEYAKLDSRVVVIHKENGGLVSARKAGLEIASGEYITYVDGDDWVDSDLYSKVFNDKRMVDVDVVIFGYKQGTEHSYIEIENSIHSGMYQNEALNDLYSRMIYTGEFFVSGVVPAAWNKIYKKSVVYDCQMDVPDMIRMGEDAAFTYATLLNAKKILVLNEIKSYHYRYVPNSMSRSFDADYFERLQIFYNMLDNRLRMKDEEVWKQLQYYWAFMIFIGFSQCVSYFMPKNPFQCRRVLKNILQQYPIFIELNFENLVCMPPYKQKQLKYIFQGKIMKYILSYYGEIFLNLVRNI